MATLTEKYEPEELQQQTKDPFQLELLDAVKRRRARSQGFDHEENDSEANLHDKELDLKMAKFLGNKQSPFRQDSDIDLGISLLKSSRDEQDHRELPSSGYLNDATSAHNSEVDTSAYNQPAPETLNKQTSKQGTRWTPSINIDSDDELVDEESLMHDVDEGLQKFSGGITVKAKGGADENLKDYNIHSKKSNELPTESIKTGSRPEKTNNLTINDNKQKLREIDTQRPVPSPRTKPAMKSDMRDRSTEDIERPKPAPRGHKTSKKHEQEVSADGYQRSEFQRQRSSSNEWDKVQKDKYDDRERVSADGYQRSEFQRQKSSSNEWDKVQKDKYSDRESARGHESRKEIFDKKSRHLKSHDVDSHDKIQKRDKSDFESLWDNKDSRHLTSKGINYDDSYDKSERLGKVENLKVDPGNERLLSKQKNTTKQMLQETDDDNEFPQFSKKNRKSFESSKEKKPVKANREPSGSKKDHSDETNRKVLSPVSPIAGDIDDIFRAGTGRDDCRNLVGTSDGRMARSRSLAYDEDGDDDDSINVDVRGRKPTSSSLKEINQSGKTVEVNTDLERRPSSSLGERKLRKKSSEEQERNHSKDLSMKGELSSDFEWPKPKGQHKVSASQGRGSPLFDEDVTQRNMKARKDRDKHKEPQFKRAFSSDQTRKAMSKENLMDYEDDESESERKYRKSERDIKSKAMLAGNDKLRENARLGFKAKQGTYETQVKTLESILMKWIERQEESYRLRLFRQSPAELGTQKKGPLKADLPIEKAARPKSGRKSSIDSSSGAKKAKTVPGEIPTTPKRSLSFTNISNIRPKSPLHDTDKKGKSNKNIDSCFIREQIYYDWLQRKSSLTKEQIKDMKMKEKEKEEEKLREEQEKKLMSKKAFEAWNASKEDKMKQKIELRKSGKKKEKEKADEERQKKMDAKKYFDSWKTRKEDDLKEKYQEKRKQEKEKKRKEMEEKLERKQDSKKVFENWKLRKDEELKEKAQELRKEKQLERQKEIEKYEKKQQSHQAYDSWKNEKLKQRKPSSPSLTQRAWCPSNRNSTNVIPEKVQPVIIRNPPDRRRTMSASGKLQNGSLRATYAKSWGHIPQYHS